MPNFDAIIIGTGQSGPALARRLVAAGWKVAIIVAILCYVWLTQRVKKPLQM